MVTEAKKEPDRLAYATGGTGTVAHLSMKQIEQQYGMLLRNVPYRGGAPAAADLVAGHVPMMVGSVQALGKFVQDGKVRALVQLGAKRHPMLPDTPTMDELGMKGFSSASWMGIFVPSARRTRSSRASTTSSRPCWAIPGCRSGWRRWASSSASARRPTRQLREGRDGALGRRGEALQHQGGVRR